MAGHAAAVPGAVHAIRVLALPSAGRDALVEAWKAWLQEAGKSGRCGRALWGDCACWGFGGVSSSRACKCGTPVSARAVHTTGRLPPGNAAGPARELWQAPPPRPAKQELRLTPGKGIQALTVSVRELIDGVVRAHKVWVWVWARWMGDCWEGVKVFRGLE